MIQKAIIFGLTVVVGITLILMYTIQREPFYSPAFKARSCFTFFNHKGVDGLIMYLEGNFYIVMMREEADRKYAGPKDGYKLGIKYLDAYAHQVKCPEGWTDHKEGRKK